MQESPEFWAKIFLGSRHRLQQLLNSHGIEGRTHVGLALELAPALTEARLKEVLSTVRTFEKILASGESERIDLWKTPNLLELSFREMGLTFSDEFTATLDPEDVVDAYNMDRLQIFRNFRFMELCGYDLHDILLHEWPVLFERSQMITNQLLQKCGECVTSGKMLTMTDVPPHFVKERLSTERQVARMEFKHAVPIYHLDGTPAGIMASSRVEIVDEAPSRHEVRFI